MRALKSEISADLLIKQAQLPRLETKYSEVGRTVQSL